jgi:ureidoglycolate lyase
MVFIHAEPVSATRFAPYGELIEAPPAPGRRPVTDALSWESSRAVVLSTTHVAPVSLPVVVDQLERHPHSSQTFLPLEVGRWIVIVASSVDPADVRAFVLGPGVGVTIGRGVWHHGLTVLDQPARFAVLMGKDGATDDEFSAVAPFTVDLG